MFQTDAKVWYDEVLAFYSQEHDEELSPALRQRGMRLVAAIRK